MDKPDGYKSGAIRLHKWGGNYEFVPSRQTPSQVYTDYWLIIKRGERLTRMQRQSADDKRWYLTRSDRLVVGPLEGFATLEEVRWFLFKHVYLYPSTYAGMYNHV